MSKKSVKNGADEEAAINRGIVQDPDTFEMSDEQFREAAEEKKRRPGRPSGSVADVRKEQVSIRLDPDVLEALRASGAGWQSRVNNILRGAITHPKAPARKRA